MTLEERVEELEKKVAALEARPDIQEQLRENEGEFMKKMEDFLQKKAGHIPE